MYEKSSSLYLEPSFKVDKDVITTALQGLTGMELDSRYDAITINKVREAFRNSTQPPYVMTEIELSTSDTVVAAEALARGIELEVESQLMDPRDHPLGDSYRMMYNFANPVAEAA